MRSTKATTYFGFARVSMRNRCAFGSVQKRLSLRKARRRVRATWRSPTPSCSFNASVAWLRCRTYRESKIGSSRIVENSASRNAAWSSSPGLNPGLGVNGCSRTQSASRRYTAQLLLGNLLGSATEPVHARNMCSIHLAGRRHPGGSCFQAPTAAVRRPPAQMCSTKNVNQSGRIIMVSVWMTTTNGADDCSKAKSSALPWEIAGVSSSLSSRLITRTQSSFLRTSPLPSMEPLSITMVS